MTQRRWLGPGLLLAFLAPGALALAGEGPAMRQVGLCYTGFGVPGSGRPYPFGSRVLVNAGEGCPTVIDVSDKRGPKILRHIPTWFFTSLIYPLPARDLAYLSNSRGPLLVLRPLKTIASRGDLKPIPWKRSWGRSFLSGLRPDGIAYCAAGKHIVALDLNDPDHPRELARIPLAKLKIEGMPTLPEDHAVGWALVTETYALAFSPDYTLSAALLSGGSRVALLRWKTPTEPILCGAFQNVEVRDRRGAAAYGRVLAMDNQRLVIGHPASTSKYWRTFRLSFWDIRDPSHPKRASEIAFDHRGTHIRDVALAGRYAFAIDGRNIASGHTVRRTQRSRLLVLDLHDLTAPKVVATWTETMPTEYSQLTLSGKTLYVNDYNYGLWIFDVSDPLRPVKLGGAPTSAEGHWLYLKDDHAFVAHTFGGTIHVVNVAEPAKPKTVGTYWDGQWLNYKAKIRGRGNAMYLPQFDGLAILDISEPSRPRRAGEFRDAHGHTLMQPCIDLAATRAFVTTPATHKAHSRVLVYDIAEPLKPRLLFAVELPHRKGFRILAAGGMLYLVGYQGERILALDASGPDPPRITADLRASEARIGAKAYSLAIRDGGGNGAPGIAFSRGYLYVVTGRPAPDEPYLLIFDVRDPKAIRPAAAFHVRNRKGWQFFACDVIIEGSRLFLGDYGCDEVYDITDPLRPRRLAQHRRSYAWQIGTLRGKHLYVPKLDGLEILEVPAR